MGELIRRVFLARFPVHPSPGPENSRDGTDNVQPERPCFFVFFLGYFVLLFAVGLFVRDSDPQPELLAAIGDLGKSLREVGDPLYFATGALDIYHFGWITPANRWIISLWPPGFMLLEAGILKLFGESAPFIVILIALSAFLGATMLLLMRRYLLELVGPICATFLPLVVFCFPVTRLYMLEPIGAVLGEGFSVAFFIIAMLLILLAPRSRPLAYAISAGTLLALAAYFRPQYELLIWFLTAAATPILGWLLFSLWSYRRLDSRRTATRSVVIILAVLTTSHLLMLPWRIHNLFEGGGLSWVSTRHLVIRNALSIEAGLAAGGGGFVIEGGGNLACKLEPSYCGQTDEKLFYRAFFDHMGEWYLRKFELLPKYWFASLRNFVNIGFLPTLIDKIVNALLLLCVLATVPLLWRTRHNRVGLLQLWICASFYMCFFVIFSFVHFEARYFYLLKIFSIVTTILLGSLAYRSKKRTPILQSVQRP